MAHREDLRNGLFTRLIEDRAGNTLAIVAAATLPMMALIGGGVDISRAYMAKTQLQAACDAGVLAGRRAMAKSGEYGTPERAKADSMFNFNFDGATVTARNTSFETDDNDEGQVTGTASTEMPTAVMKIFGKREIPLNVSCMAELQLANVDVMFVLDTTGSMGGSRIEGLRDAVRDFHATIAEAVIDEETRVRYGFVPYSTTVNARELITTWGMPREYFTDTTSYQSRVALFDTPDTPAIDTVTVVSTDYQTYSSNISNSQCTSYGNNKYPDSNGNNPQNISGTAPNKVTQYRYTRETPTWSGNPSNRSCTRKRERIETTYWVPYKFTRWIYRQDVFDTSDFKNSLNVSLATSNSQNSARVPERRVYSIQELARLNNVPGTRVTGVSTSSSSWNGCIEERNTVVASNFKPVPEGALDLDINLEPFDDASRWKPIWREAAFYRGVGDNPESNSGTKPSAPCPAPMLLFQEIDTSAGTTVPGWLNDYLENELVATGNTYHDIGMIWGGRLGSPRGIFADNVNEGDAENVSRHLLFMTDGVMEPNRTVYTAYGTEQSDTRIGPSGNSNSQLATRHTARFRAACDAAKAEGYTIYVVSFGTSITSDLQYCSSGGRAYRSNNTTELRNTFRFIASQVADLRLGA